eukprot:CAMPEP_0201283974 /NCGR_PEP_ID=MMETSP1317-20130820/57247_1 /ASSEMBLY_ACC=CAM_ASM_000770 /TAXON_ID=187299 /ORGANISM="Undescribed Undescribed, Strain Undescribed" /LENGTH=52 /DNA_ID=CAMNT_0047602225 /DNA_START=219 /DNA_END=377 /DNA_ORIENTATION=-
MEKYNTLFMDNGFDEMDIVMEMDDQMLQDLKGAIMIPMGHRLKIIKKLREVR